MSDDKIELLPLAEPSPMMFELLELQRELDDALLKMTAIPPALLGRDLYNLQMDGQRRQIITPYLRLGSSRAGSVKYARYVRR